MEAHGFLFNENTEGLNKYPCFSDEQPVETSVNGEDTGILVVEPEKRKDENKELETVFKVNDSGGDLINDELEEGEIVEGETLSQENDATTLPKFCSREQCRSKCECTHPGTADEENSTITKTEQIFVPLSDPQPSGDRLTETPVSVSREVTTSANRERHLKYNETTSNVSDHFMEHGRPGVNRFSARKHNYRHNGSSENRHSTAFQPRCCECERRKAIPPRTFENNNPPRLDSRDYSSGRRDLENLLMRPEFPVVRNGICREQPYSTYSDGAGLQRTSIAQALLALSEAAVSAAEHTNQIYSNEYDEPYFDSDEGASTTNESVFSLSSSSSSDQESTTSPPLHSECTVPSDGQTLTQAAAESGIALVDTHPSVEQNNLPLKDCTRPKHPQSQKRPYEVLSDGDMPRERFSTRAQGRITLSRRERALQQLKAVEDGVARRLSNNT